MCVYVCVCFNGAGDHEHKTCVTRAHDSHSAAWSSYEGKKIHFQRRNKIRPSSFVYTEWTGSSVLCDMQTILNKWFNLSEPSLI